MSSNTQKHTFREITALILCFKVLLCQVRHLSPVPELGLSTEDISIMTGDEFAFSTCAFTSKLVGLPHVVGSTILVELAGGSHYRVEIPPLCSTALGEFALIL